MKLARRLLWLLYYQWLAGLCDTLTGLLLMLAPAWTLSRMGIVQGRQSAELVGFIGAFVCSVGIGYLHAARLPMTAANAPRWETVWFLTAIARSLVAAFVATQIFFGRMEGAWITVVLTDAGLALFQWLGLWRGWLRFSDTPTR
jgi:hypothetical protein